jgi:predicted enzyme related to lactoylglutathione lyase
MTDFYADVVGWTPAEILDQEQTIFTSDGDRAAGLFRKSMELPTSTWILHVRVSDIDSTLERFKRLGGSQVGGVVSISDGGRSCRVADPTGSVFALHEQARE